MGDDEGRGECGKCGDEYEPYEAFIPKNFNAVCAWLEMKDKYEWFCPDCLAECPGGEKIAVSEEK